MLLFDNNLFIPVSNLVVGTLNAVPDIEARPRIPVFTDNPIMSLVVADVTFNDDTGDEINPVSLANNFGIYVKNEVPEAATKLPIPRFIEEIMVGGVTSIKTSTDIVFTVVTWSVVRVTDPGSIEKTRVSSWTSVPVIVTKYVHVVEPGEEIPAVKPDAAYVPDPRLENVRIGDNPTFVPYNPSGKETSIEKIKLPDVNAAFPPDLSELLILLSNSIFRASDIEISGITETKCKKVKIILFYTIFNEKISRQTYLLLQ